MKYNYDDERPDVYPAGGEPATSGESGAADEQPDVSPPGMQDIYTPLPTYGMPTVEQNVTVPELSAPVEQSAVEPEPPAETDVSDSEVSHNETYSQPGIVRPQPWCDPAYSTVPEQSPSVYSPGIPQPTYQQKPRTERPAERANPPSGKRRGGFMRAACLVLVCAVASATATLGVLEYKLEDNSAAPPTEQSVSERPSSSGKDKSESVTPDVEEPIATPSMTTRPTINSGIAMSAQEIYEMACRQVVVITTSVTTQSGYFSQSGTSVISGSGFIISEDGYIVTNYHVIEAAYRNGGELNVTLNDGNSYYADIIGVEPGNDIAVIKINATGLDPVTMGDSSAMRVGETVYAVGNPLGELIYTMTDGMISALDREIIVDNVAMNMFQISAAVNSGNSGGPVYDTYGNVLGVVTAKSSISAVEGIGFAIPINDAMRIASQLMENGYIVDSKAYMGITVRTVDSATASYYDWVVGAYVLSVEPGSCADKAGLKVGDIISQLGGISVTSQESLLYAKKCFNAGDTAELVIRRAGEDVTLTITFDTEPETSTATQPQQETPADVPPTEGRTEGQVELPNMP